MNKRFIFAGFFMWKIQLGQWYDWTTDRVSEMRLNVAPESCIWKHNEISPPGVQSNRSLSLPLLKVAKAFKAFFCKFGSSSWIKAPEPERWYANARPSSSSSLIYHIIFYIFSLAENMSVYFVRRWIFSCTKFNKIHIQSLQRALICFITSLSFQLLKVSCTF